MREEVEVKGKVIEILAKTIAEKLWDGERAIKTSPYLSGEVKMLLWVLEAPERLQEALIKTLFDEGLKRIGKNPPFTTEDFESLSEEERDDLADQIKLIAYESQKRKMEYWERAVRLYYCFETSAPLDYIL